MNNENLYTVTMTGTHWVKAKDEKEAVDIVSEALLHLSQVDKRVEDTETHWAQAVTLTGFHTTIDYDNVGTTDYDKALEEQGKKPKAEPSDIPLTLGKDYTVWVGGTEVNDYYVTFDSAVDIALCYREDGYDDICIQYRPESTR